MKKVLLVTGIALLSLGSCKKNWICTQVITNSAGEVHADIEHDFEGNKEEMEAFEASGNMTSTMIVYDPGEPFGVGYDTLYSVMECK